MMDFTTALNPLVNLADKLGLLQAVKGKLVRQPHPAAQELGTVLEEIAKVYEAILSELSKYLSIAFYPGQPPDKQALQRQELVELENSATIVIRIGDAKGSCEKIMNIYDTFLSPWFSGVLSPAETEMMHSLFRDLDKFDGIMLDAITGFANRLSQQATETLNLIDDERVEEATKLVEARQQILRARKDVAPQRQEMLSAIQRLYDLQAEFIAVSGVV
jgi:hypothetical protein